MPYPLRQLTEEEYPSLLKEIPGKPKALYIRGTLPPESDFKYLCVVGSRACTPYGRRMTAQIIAGLAKYPIVIVSGMALGIDNEAHKAALDIGLPTIAILPSSCDEESLYPKSNWATAKRILSQGGALISETKGPYKAALHDFPRRDRIMAGFAHASLIIEAGEKSGTLITARLALDYNREVMAIPHELGRESGVGANRLLREGATLVRGAEDVLEVLGFKLPDNPTQATLPTDLSDTEVTLLNTLQGSLQRDELIQKSNLSAQDTSIALSSLLIRGLIVERLGKIERL